jgi:uncharacterized repeat protein (TIGR01451 family)
MSAIAAGALLTAMAGPAFAADKSQPKVDDKKTAQAQKDADKKAAEQAKKDAKKAAGDAKKGDGGASPSSSDASGPTSDAPAQGGEASAASAGDKATAGSTTSPTDKSTKSNTKTNKTNNKTNGTATTCGENSFLGTQFPAAGTELHAGDAIGAVYHDETPLNDKTVIFQIDGAPVAKIDLAAATVPKGDKFATRISTVIPKNLDTGDHTAYLKAEDTDQNKAGGDCGEATWTFTVKAPDVDLSVTKAADRPAVKVGETINYTMVVKNNGPDADTNVTMVDNLPKGVQFVSVSPQSCSGNDLQVSCAFGDMAAGASQTVTVTIHAPSTAGTITNKVEVTGDAKEKNMANNHAEATVDVSTPETPTTTPPTTPGNPQVDLAVVKVGDPGSVLVNGHVVYTITAINNGPDTATGVKVTDTLPAGVRVNSIKSSLGSCKLSGLTITCSLGTLAKNAHATIIVDTNAPATAGEIVNHAHIQGNEPDSNLANNDDQAVTEVSQVLAAVVTPASTPVAAVAVAAPKSPLPFTGSESELLAMLGTGIMISGLGFGLYGRRRRTA